MGPMDAFPSSRPAVRIGVTGVALTLALTACAGDDGQPASGETAGAPPATGVAPTTASPGGTDSPTSTALPTAGLSDTEQARAGSWPVADAGTVVFETSGGALRLVSADPKPGWNRRLADNSATHIEAHFTKGNTDWKFEAEVDDGRLEISRERDTRPAPAGSYRVLDAATVSFTASGNSLRVGTITPSAGWRETIRDVSSDDIEIDFTKGAATAEFEAEIDRGQIKLELSQKVTGPAPR